ncbi:hypothetical protein ACPOL_5059 [Acidisarcina polymorpha]|uniref:O-antigen ligase-related domain-containing protein n=1 Tax=Acidisarcina polymorpha TaxID=2211140 RepID=A0A2Z5G699_9BACT|nr:O-antigen ligase family protein [Acidisarcina polymorpha]AXC14317.1 hypothetical protein ACPOL_5059 [Acidisarcina polymorpha]
MPLLGNAYFAILVKGTIIMNGFTKTLMPDASTLPWVGRRDAVKARPDHRTSQSFLGILLSTAIVLYITLFVVNGALPQLEIFLTRGHIPITANSFQVLVLLMAGLVLFRRRLRNNPLMLATMLLAFYVVVDFFLLSAFTNYSFSDLKVSMGSYLIPLVIIGFALSTPIIVRSEAVVALVMVLFVACFCVSVLQFVTNTPVVATESLDNSFTIPSFIFGGKVRAFSLFQSGLHAGIFYCLTAAFGTSLCFKSGRQKVFGYIIVVMSAFGCYATLTRLTILGFLACVATVILIHLKSTRKLVPFVPLVWALMGALLVAQGYYASGQASGMGIGNTSSLESRLMEWRYYTVQYLGETPGQLAFGTGTSPWREVGSANMPATAAPVSIDNGYIEMLLNSGIVGLLLVVFFSWRVWSVLSRKALKFGSDFVIATAAIFSVLPFFSSINDLLPQIFIMALLGLICDDGKLASAS